MNPIIAFGFLQALDLLTTLIGLRMGCSEASPGIRSLFGALGVTGAIVLSKAMAFALAGGCILAHRPRVIRWINVWYAALALWNLSVILRLLAR